MSSNSSHVAGISPVMKHITINRPQIVSLTKLYLTLRKKLLFVFVSVVLPIEQDAVGAYIWAWSYYAYDTLNMPYCS